jgi:hypothetical protein
VRRRLGVTKWPFRDRYASSAAWDDPPHCPDLSVPAALPDARPSPAAFEPPPPFFPERAASAWPPAPPAAHPHCHYDGGGGLDLVHDGHRDRVDPPIAALIAALVSPSGTPPPAAPAAEFSILPRPKAGRAAPWRGRAPVTLTRERLERLGRMPLASAARATVTGPAPPARTATASRPTW